VTPLPSPEEKDAATAPLVSILVVSYNTRDMTLDCLRSVVAETRAPYELLVLDNASHDGSAAAIAEAFPQARLVASPTNHGFAGGNNLLAQEARGEYILLLNPDTVVLDGAIDRLLAFAGARPEAGIWGGRTVFADGRLNPKSVFGDQTLWSLFCRVSGLALLFPRSTLFNPEDLGGWARDSERGVDFVSGCFLLIRRALWERLGGFDLTFVMYGEEADLCRRARALGARPRMTPEATIVHHAGAASAKRADKEVLVMKARMTLARRHLPPWQRPVAAALLRIWPLTRSLAGELAARLTGRRGAAEAAAHWRAVWAERETWRDGFPTLPHPAPVASTPAAPTRPEGPKPAAPGAAAPDPGPEAAERVQARGAGS
jgi:GT2 family glycosyltransferase